jgi:hypothetical protein
MRRRDVISRPQGGDTRKTKSRLAVSGTAGDGEALFIPVLDVIYGSAIDPWFGPLSH